MTSRERIKAILSRDVPDRMGLYEHFWKETIPDYWSKEGFPEEVNPREYFGCDIAPLDGPWLKLAPFPERDETVEETDEWRVSTNGYGATLKHWKNKSGTPAHVAFDCHSREVWEKKYKPPVAEFDPARVDFEVVRPSHKTLMAGDKFVVLSSMAHFEILRVMLGDVVMLQSLLLEPEWIHDVCSTYTRFFVRAYEHLFREVGLPDGVFIYEDLGYRNGPFMSDATYRDVLMPHHRDLFGFLHEHDLPVILHSCGDVRKLVPAMIDAGMDCLQPMEAKAGCDVLEFNRLYDGRISFMGNIDVTKLNTNNRDVIRTEIETKMRGLRERRVPYIFHSDHSIPPDVRLESYKFALEVYRENADY